MGTGALVFEGRGRTDDFASAAERPWAESMPGVRTTRVAETVTLGTNTLKGIAATAPVNGLVPSDLFSAIGGQDPAGAISGAEFAQGLTSNVVASVGAVLAPDVPLVKDDDRFFFCATPADAKGAPLQVKRGYLKMGGEVCHNPYWRMTFKKAMKPQYRYTKAEFPSFDETVNLMV